AVGAGGRGPGEGSRAPVGSPLAANGPSSLTGSGSKKWWTRWGACAARNATKPAARSRLAERRHAHGLGRTKATIFLFVYQGSRAGCKLKGAEPLRKRAAWP